MDERELMERSLRVGLPALGLALDGEQIGRLLDFGQAVLAQNRGWTAARCWTWARARAFPACR